MKRIFTFLIFMLLMSSFTFAQKSYKVSIHHNFGESSFEYDKASENNLSEGFDVQRLQYYISELVLIHDGGIETSVEDSWVLVNADEVFTFKLGIFDGITNIEGLKYGIGVSPDVNHEDPTTWAFGHPLAPVNPSMHWGWAAGYRFLAMEGFCGDDLKVGYQLHGLGDQNYFVNTIEVQGVEENGDVIINIDADINKALEDISISQGPISHGDTGPAKAALENFRDYVFSASQITSSTSDFDFVDFNVFPNPSINGQFTVEVEDFNSLKIQVFNVDGKMIVEQEVTQNATDIVLGQPGFYFLNLVSNSGRTISKKITVQ